MTATAKVAAEMSTITEWVDVCPLAQIDPEFGVCARVGERHVALFYLPDEAPPGLFAIDNIDPFSGASVLSRGIVGDLKGELVVASPIYKQHFSLITGRCLEDDSVCLDRFAVRVDERGMVQVASSPQPAPTPASAQL